MDEKYGAVSFAELSRQMKSLGRSSGEFKSKEKVEFGETSGLELDLAADSELNYSSALGEAQKVERKLSAQYYDSSMSVPRPPQIGMQLTQKPMGRQMPGAKAPQPRAAGIGISAGQPMGAAYGTAAVSPAFAPPPASPPVEPASAPSTPIATAIPPHAPGAMPDLGKAVSVSAGQQKPGMLDSLFGAFGGLGKKKELAQAAPTAAAPSPKEEEKLRSMQLPPVLQKEEAVVSPQEPIAWVPPPPIIPRKEQEEHAPGEGGQAPPSKIGKMSKSLSNIFPLQPQIPLLPPAEESRTFAMKKKFQEWGGVGEKEEGAQEPREEEGSELQKIAAKKAAGINAPDAKKKGVRARAPKGKAPVLQAEGEEQPTIGHVRREMGLGKAPPRKQARIGSIMDEIERRLAEEDTAERREAAKTPALERLAEVRRRISERQEKAGYVPDEESKEDAKEPQTPPSAQKAKPAARKTPALTAVQKGKPKPVSFGIKPSDEEKKGKFQVSIKPIFKQGEKEEGEAQKPYLKKSRFAATEEKAEEEAQLPAMKKSRFARAQTGDGEEPQPRKARQTLPPKTRMPPKQVPVQEEEGQEEEFSPRATRRLPSSILPKSAQAKAPAGKASAIRAAIGKAAAGKVPSGGILAKSAARAQPYTPSPPKGLAAKFAKPPEEKKARLALEGEQGQRKWPSAIQTRRPMIVEPEEAGAPPQEEGRGYAPRQQVGYAPRSRLRRPLPGAARSPYATSLPPRSAIGRPIIAPATRGQPAQEIAPPMPPVPKPGAIAQQTAYSRQQGAYQPPQRPPIPQQGQSQPSEQPPPPSGDIAPPVPSQQSTAVKESARALGEEALIAYAKENLKWLYEIYVMGGLTREDFVAKVKDKMNEMPAQGAQAASASAPENPALEKLEKMQKKFRK